MLHTALHPSYSSIHGVGIVALRDVPLGTAVWWPCPRCSVIPADQQAGTPEEVLRWLAEFGYRRTDGSLIAPCRGAYLLNHSCDAPVLDIGLSVGIAVRDIRAGQEVTCDYRGFRYEDPWSFPCRCGSANCVGEVRSTAGCPPSGLVRRWSSLIENALDAASGVPQQTTVLSGDIHGPLTVPGTGYGR